MKFSIILLSALTVPATAAIRRQSVNRPGARKLEDTTGKGKGKGGSGCFENEGYEYLATLVKENECMTDAPLVDATSDSVGEVCSAAGGYSLYAFYNAEGIDVALPLGCCPKCDLDLELLTENCSGEHNFPASGCADFATEGLAVTLSGGMTWCCFEPA
jgi:hypothetical protein